MKSELTRFGNTFQLYHLMIYWSGKCSTKIKIKNTIYRINLVRINFEQAQILNESSPTSRELKM